MSEITREMVIEAAKSAFEGAKIERFARMARAAGFIGGKGGWIYGPGGGLAICQGWSALARRVLWDEKMADEIVNGKPKAAEPTPAPAAQPSRMHVIATLQAADDATRAVERNVTAMTEAELDNVAAMLMRAAAAVKAEQQRQTTQAKPHPLDERARRALRNQLARAEHYDVAARTLRVWIAQEGLTHEHVMELARDWGVPVRQVPWNASAWAVQSAIIEHARS